MKQTASSVAGGSGAATQNASSKAASSGKAKNKKKKSSKVTSILLIVILLGGLGLLIYPTFSDYWNSFHQSRAIAGYAEAVADIDESDYAAMWQAAVDYNTALAKKGSRWTLTPEETKEYESILDVSGTGIIGYIEIPSIKVELPIYHGTDEAVLQIAIGHIAGSSFPVGGESTHCVLSGHRGLPSAKLFTNLDKLTEGDYFEIRVLNEKLTYEVDQILIVEPSDVSALGIEPGKDYCTLVTCTPYGVNTHRMLVRGHRIDNFNDANSIMATADAQLIDRNVVALCIGVPALVLFFLRDMITGGRRRRKRIARWEARDRKLYGDDSEESEPAPTSEAPAADIPAPDAPQRYQHATRSVSTQIQPGKAVSFRVETGGNATHIDGTAGVSDAENASGQTGKENSQTISVSVTYDKDGRPVIRKS